MSATINSMAALLHILFLCFLVFWFLIYLSVMGSGGGGSTRISLYCVHVVAITITVRSSPATIAVRPPFSSC